VTFRTRRAKTPPDREKPRNVAVDNVGFFQNKNPKLPKFPKFDPIKSPCLQQQQYTDKTSKTKLKKKIKQKQQLPEVDRSFFIFDASSLMLSLSCAKLCAMSAQPANTGHLTSERDRKTLISNKWLFKGSAL
jgi:hypothetical protein